MTGSIIAVSEDAAQVLLEANLGLFCGARRIGIEGVEKIPNLLPDLLIPQWR
jgi:hypothetical protein